MAGRCNRATGKCISTTNASPRNLQVDGNAVLVVVAVVAVVVVSVVIVLVGVVVVDVVVVDVRCCSCCCCG